MRHHISALTKKSVATKKIVPWKDSYVNLGEPFSFLCSSGEPIETCSIDFISSSIRSLKIVESKPANEYSYLGRGFEHGDCGIRYWNTSLDMQGTVICAASVIDSDFDEVWEMTELHVSIPSFQVNLEANNKNFQFKENDEMSFLCSSNASAEVPLNISLFLGKVFG